MCVLELMPTQKSVKPARTFKTLGLALQLPSDTVSVLSKEPKLYLHIRIYQC